MKLINQNNPWKSEITPEQKGDLWILKMGEAKFALFENSIIVLAKHILLLLYVVLLRGAVKRMPELWFHCCYVVSTAKKP